jgi:hypothetical protein
LSSEYTMPITSSMAKASPHELPAERPAKDRQSRTCEARREVRAHHPERQNINERADTPANGGVAPEIRSITPRSAPSSPCSESWVGPASEALHD